MPIDSQQAEISRVTRTRRQVQTSYDALSGWYELVIDPFERGCRAAGVRKLGVQKSETVLEIGFGTGQALVLLAEQVGVSGKVYGVDLSQSMCNIAHRRAEDQGLADRVLPQRGDATRLPIDNSSVNAVFMCFTLELFDTPDIPVVLRECQRVLQSGGRLCVVALAKHNCLATRIYEWLHQRFPRLLDCRPIYPEQALSDAGFHITAIENCSLLGLPVEMVLAKK